MEARKRILLRTYLLYTLMCVIAVLICARVFMIQYTQGAKWKQEELELTTAYRTIPAVRGNIYAEDGSLLATSLPFYDIAMDVNTEYLTNKVFNAKIDSLCIAFAGLFKNKTKGELYRLLVSARHAGDRYVLLERKVSYNDLQRVKKFPLFRLGRFKGGLIVTQTSLRELPFRDLASRTIGYARPNIKPVGLEGAFNEYLQGINGQGLMEKTAGGVWIPLNDQDDLQPRNGEDIISTLNINYQDVAENALREQLIIHHANHGCVVLMEVKTGRVLAIANLSRIDSSDDYAETYNYAIGETAEPGSIFKLASMLVGIDDGYIKPSDSINIENGTHLYYDRVMRDADHDEQGRITVQRAFEISSNVGISKIIYKYYANRPGKFINGLCRLGLNEPLHLSIPGEGVPMIPSPFDKTWSGTSLPWLAIGYGLTITPLQILTLYNAVANNGVMVKPQFIDAIVKDGKVIQPFQPKVINPSICSASTLAKIRKMLEGVVLHGTAMNLNNSVYQIAGKTGTAQIADKGHYKNGAEVNYQASFAGYFPANNPQYSCIVVVNSPSTDGYYGNITAGPIFREIADKVYASSIGIDPCVNKPGYKAKEAPCVKSGDYNDTRYVLSGLGIPNRGISGHKKWMVATVKDSVIHISSYYPEKALSEGIMPDLYGMDAEDAVYLLENSHLNVTIKGCGSVSQQSLPPGTKFQKGQTIYLLLS